MGTIVSPSAGGNVYKGQIVPVTYRSDTVNFNCGGSSGICTLVFKVDGTDISGSIPVTQQGPAPQTQAAYNITMPVTGTSVTIDIEGWSVGGQLNDTAQVVLNLIDLPTVTCGAASITDTSVQLQGNLQGTLPVGGSVRFRYGNTLNGPYPTPVAAAPYAVGGVTANLTGLTPNTAYHFICEILDATGASVAVSSDCSFTTANTVVPPVTSLPMIDAQVVKLCSISGVTVLRNCTTSVPVLLVNVTSADGDVIPTDSTEFTAAATGAGVFSTMGYYRSYYADVNGKYLTPQPATSSICLPSSAGRIEIICRCDDTDADGVGDTQYRQIVKIDDAGVVTVLATYNRTMTAVYTPIAPIDCSAPGDNLIAAVPAYDVKIGAGVWTLNADSILPTYGVTVTVVAVGSTATPPTITTKIGTKPLYLNQSVSWGTQYDRDVSGLRPPLVLTTHAGDIVAVNWVEESI